MYYKCSNCGTTVSKSSTICPNCRARLGGIRCQNCGFVGGTNDFRNDTCPKCYSVVRTQAGSNTKNGWVWWIVIIGVFIIFTLLNR